MGTRVHSIEPPKFMTHFKGELPGIVHPLDRGWHYLGVLKAPTSIPHICRRDQASCYDRDGGLAEMIPRRFTSLLLRPVTIREAHFKNGLAFQFLDAFVGQCPRCECIFWAMLGGRGAGG